MLDQGQGPGLEITQCCSERQDPIIATEKTYRHSIGSESFGLVAPFDSLNDLNRLNGWNRLTVSNDLWSLVNEILADEMRKAS